MFVQPPPHHHHHHPNHSMDAVWPANQQVNQHVFTRHPGGSYSSPRPRHRHILSMPNYAVSTSVPYLPTTASLHTEPQRKAAEAAAAAERMRRVECEKEEAHMDADQLRQVLKQERRRLAQLAADLAAAKCTAVQHELEEEICEEHRVNDLLRRLDHYEEQQQQAHA